MKELTRLIACSFVACSLAAYSLSQVHGLKKVVATGRLAESRYCLGDTIVGRFNGATDTLVAVPVDTVTANSDPENPYAGHHYVWLVKSLGGTVSDLTFKNTIGVRLVAEGDLDGDGRDEFGYITQWPTSNWTSYKLFTFRDGQWSMLIKPTALWQSHIEAGNDLYNPEGLTESDIARPAGEKGKFHIRFSDVRNGGDDFLFVDTIVTVDLQPVVGEP